MLRLVFRAIMLLPGPYHVNEVRCLQLDPSLNNLLKAFILQPAVNLTLGATPGRTACSYIVAQSSCVWGELVLCLSTIPHYIPLEVFGKPASPIWLACHFGWLGLVEYLCQNTYNGIDEVRELYIRDFDEPLGCG